MKIHTTNYKDTFIEIADDCPTANGEIPPAKMDIKTVANSQFELISKHPYKFTSDDILFQVFADRNDLTESESLLVGICNPDFRGVDLKSTIQWLR